jgi:hypothetical protein
MEIRQKEREIPETVARIEKSHVVNPYIPAHHVPGAAGLIKMVKFFARDTSL